MLRLSILRASKRLTTAGTIRNFASAIPELEEVDGPQAPAPGSHAQLPFAYPLRDVNFLFNEVFDAPAHYKKLQSELSEEAGGGEDAEPLTPDFVDMINKEGAKFAEETIAPLYGPGDTPCDYRPNGDVITPVGYREAYQEFAAAGWSGLTVPIKYGGQGMPMSMGVIKSEMLGTANWSWAMYPGLSVGAMNTLILHGSEWMKERYLTKLSSGEWTGTMCLTEPHCGTDLAQVATKAVPAGKQGEHDIYDLTGTKVYISSGEHDMADNIVHIVLAKLPDAPHGTKGISLFLVPKFMPDADGNIPEGAEKNVVCAGIESKMGIKSSATCVMSFENSKGFLIGEANDGLQQMFTFMNTARLGTAMQGVCHMERAYQGALPWVMDRTSMRALSGKKDPDQVADRIIHHPDVRKNMLTIKALCEGGRAMIYEASLLADGMMHEDEEIRHKCEDTLGLHTPTLKAFLTELGVDASSLAMQVFGGAGYIKDYGMEQIMRDARISTLYEGTTGIQGLDLLGRKIIMDKGKLLKEHMATIAKTSFEVGTSSHAFKYGLVSKSAEIAGLAGRTLYTTARILAHAANDKEAVGAASVDFLMFQGYMNCGYQWLRMMNVAAAALEADPNMDAADRKFYEAKLNTGEFYFDRILPKAYVHSKMSMSSPKSIMKMEMDQWDLNTTLPSDSGNAFGKDFVR